MKTIINIQTLKTALFFITGVLTIVANTAMAADIPSEVTLFKNVNIFDGVNEKRLEGYDVLVVNNLIKKIDRNIQISKTYEIDVKTGGYKAIPSGGMCEFVTSEPMVVTVYEPKKTVKKEVTVNVIDGKGRTLMPGLIDAHWHTMFNFWPVSKVMNADLGFLSIVASKYAGDTLMRGFTTVRDVGGNVYGVKNATDAGFVVGPRIYPSGPYIGQTGGHNDFRGPLAVPRNPNTPLDYHERTGLGVLADGVPEVLLRTREILRMGASQVKAMAGGGVSSLYDPLDVTQYTFEEAKAVVDAAKNWNTYVAIHANTDAAIRMWIEAGAMSVEHGFFIEEETAKLMAKKGVWWSFQPMDVDGPDALQFENPVSTAKYVQCVSGLEKAMKSAKKYGVKIAYGTDMLFDPAMAAKQGKFLAKMKKWFTPYEALKIATHDNAQLLKLSGPRDPYPGELGAVKEGALADLILVEGNPLEDLDLVADPAKNFVIIMKDGKIYKNTVK